MGNNVNQQLDCKKPTVGGHGDRADLINVEPQYSDWYDFACGGGAALSNIGITFPAFKLIVRQQVDGISTLKAFQQMQKEGLRNAYRGVVPPLLQKGTSLSVMFGVYNKSQRTLSMWYPGTNGFVLQVFSAMLAGTMEATLTPFERVQTLLSDRKHNSRIANSIHAVLKIKKHYGIKEYYRGFTAILLRNGPSSSIFFTCRGPVKDLLPTSHTQIQSSIEDFVSGAVLGATISTLFYPLNVVKSNMQRRLGGKFVSIWSTLLFVYNSRGRKVSRMYFGVGLNFTRAIVSWGIINSTYEILKSALTEPTW